MSKLSARERTLLDAARKGWGPSTSVARSVRAGVTERLRRDPTLGMDAPGPRDVSAAVDRVAAARALVHGPWGGVATGLTVVGLCIAVGIRGFASEPATTVVETPAITTAAPSAPRPPEPQPIVASATVPLDSLPDAPPATSVPEPPPKPNANADRAAARAGASRPSTKPRAVRAASTVTADTIADEVALVRAAQRSLRDGSPANALTSLTAHASRFPNGALREERMTLQVLSLCALGDLAKARRIRADLEQIAPASSHLQRLSCAEAK